MREQHWNAAWKYFRKAHGMQRGLHGPEWWSNDPKQSVSYVVKNDKKGFVEFSKSDAKQGTLPREVQKYSQSLAKLIDKNPRAALKLAEDAYSQNTASRHALFNIFILIVSLPHLL